MDEWVIEEHSVSADQVVSLEQMPNKHAPPFLRIHDPDNETAAGDIIVQSKTDAIALAATLRVLAERLEDQ